MSDQVIVKLSRTDALSPSFALVGDESILKLLIDLTTKPDVSVGRKSQVDVLQQDLLRTLQAMQSLKWQPPRT